MTKQQFIAAGQRLFGEYGWKVRLARALGKSRQTISAYATGAPIPQDTEMAIELLEVKKNGERNVTSDA